MARCTAKVDGSSPSSPAIPKSWLKNKPTMKAKLRMLDRDVSVWDRRILMGRYSTNPITMKSWRMRRALVDQRRKELRWILKGCRDGR